MIFHTYLFPISFHSHISFRQLLYEVGRDNILISKQKMHNKYKSRVTAAIFLGHTLSDKFAPNIYCYFFKLFLNYYSYMM